ncbi:glutathione S-transferase [Cylindrobasidium torrendii FP15055 ss-10]|uniref:glutathione transferase n=1 Tax=Cylindrobasidium torrendii FP15055 ss-10 TaxID=1314674 RepID=A0A0D7BQI3_9AGAR|nr:glutathione S-transferase [Cylindrobasidium torrendii FP15055 ss-10]
MVVNLYGFVGSTYTKRAAITLHEKQVPFIFHPIDYTKKEHKLPEHTAKHPFGQVPVLEDDGITVYESRAIARFIALKYSDQGLPLIPPISDLAKTAAFETAMQVENQQFDVWAARIVVEKLIKRLFNPDYEQNTALVDEAITTLNAKLDVFEKLLSEQAYLAGDEITLPDLNIIPLGVKLQEALGVDILENSHRPSVTKWWQRLTARPSWIAVQDGVKTVEKY